MPLPHRRRIPVVLTPITLNNYGGTCNYEPPGWIKPFLDASDPPRPAARATRHLKEEAEFGDSVNRPYIHIVDGGVSDNLGMRSVLDSLEVMEALHLIGQPSPLDHIRRIVVFVVNSLSTPKTAWDKSESPPGTLQILVKATGVPIDHYSYEATELLKDSQSRWQSMRRVRESRAFSAEQGRHGSHRIAHAGRNDLRHRRVVRPVDGQGGTGLPERTAHIVFPAARGESTGCVPPRGRSSWRRPISSGC
ncbi:hypothetical protein ACU4HD_38500 [Cupriavidus basilensis]